MAANVFLGQRGHHRVAKANVVFLSGVESSPRFVGWNLAEGFFENFSRIIVIFRCEIRRKSEYGMATAYVAQNLHLGLAVYRTMSHGSGFRFQSPSSDLSLSERLESDKKQCLLMDVCNYTGIQIGHFNIFRQKVCKFKRRRN